MNLLGFDEIVLEYKYKKYGKEFSDTICIKPQKKEDYNFCIKSKTIFGLYQRVKRTAENIYDEGVNIITVGRITIKSNGTESEKTTDNKRNLLCDEFMGKIFITGRGIKELTA